MNLLSVTYFASAYPFEKPIHRLIMCRIVQAGSPNAQGERVIDNEVLRSFCCCTSQMLFKELKVLERDGVLTVRQCAPVGVGESQRLESARGYTITPKEFQ